MPERVDVPLRGRTQDQVPREVFGHDDLRGAIAGNQAGRTTRGRPGLQPALVRVQLATYVVIHFAIRLDDVSPPGRLDLEDDVVDKTPAVVAHDVQAGQPSFKKGALAVAQLRAKAGHLVTVALPQPPYRFGKSTA